MSYNNFTVLANIKKGTQKWKYLFESATLWLFPMIAEANYSIS